MKDLFTNFKIIHVFLLLIICLHCGSCTRFEGVIEIRQKDVYLVNSSSTKGFSFTIKQTEIIDDSVYNYSTDIMDLAPGDEKRLGVTDSMSLQTYSLAKRQVIKIYDVPDSSIKNSKISKKSKSDINDLIWAEFKKRKPSNYYVPMPDTVINGVKVSNYLISEEEYYDSLHPIGPNYFRFEFKVTGQSSLKN